MLSNPHNFTAISDKHYWKSTSRALKAVASGYGANFGKHFVGHPFFRLHQIARKTEKGFLLIYWNRFHQHYQKRRFGWGIWLQNWAMDAIYILTKRICGTNTLVILLFANSYQLWVQTHGQNCQYVAPSNQRQRISISKWCSHFDLFLPIKPLQNTKPIAKSNAEKVKSMARKAKD